MSDQRYSAGFDCVPAMPGIHPLLESSDMTLLPAYSNLANDISSIVSDSFNNTILPDDCFYKTGHRSLTDSQAPNSTLLNNASVSNYAGKRRFRTNFTEHQSMFLEDSFKASHYPDHKTKKYMAQHLNIPEDRITVWFQNRRAKWRRKEHRLRDKTKTDSFCSQPFGYNCCPNSTLEHSTSAIQNIRSYAPSSQNCHEPLDLKNNNFPIGSYPPAQSNPQ